MEQTEREFYLNLGRLFSDIVHRLDRIDFRIGRVLQGEQEMALDISTLQAAVDADTTVDQSAITLLNGLAQALRDAAADPAAVQAIADQLNANSANLAAAVSANTPVIETPPPVDPNA